MAFDPSKYKTKAAKKLPVILLLDVSGSMAGEKIDTLYDCVVDMVQSFVNAAVKETIIDVAIITFGDSVDLHTPYTSAVELQKNGISRFRADGMTPLGTALRMADMLRVGSFIARIPRSRLRTSSEVCRRSHESRWAFVQFSHSESSGC